MKMSYSILNRNIWSVIINFLSENEWKNIKCLSKTFLKLIQSNLLIKRLTFKQLCLGGYIESLLIFLKDNPIQNLDKGLKWGCVNGHQEIVNLMIFEGARDWVKGLKGA